MTTRSRSKSFFPLGVVGSMILLTLGQLMGTFWFHKATGMGNGGTVKLDAIQLAIKVQPSHSYYWFSTGREFQNLTTESELTLIERRHLLEEARNYLERAISLEPTASLYHYHLGWVYAALSPYRTSLKWKTYIAFSRAISLNPTNTDFRWGVANYYLNQYGRFLKAEEAGRSETDFDWTRKNFQQHFRALLKVHPAYDLKRVLDRCFAVTKKYDDLKGLIPDQPSYHLRLAAFLNQKGMWHEAKKEFEIAISQDPTDAAAYHAYGSALFARKHYEEALAIWKKEQAISPQNPRSYLAVSKALWTLKRKGEAIAELERLVGIHRDQTSYRLTLAARLEGAGNPEKALKAYQDAMEKNPSDPKIYAQMASYWARRKNYSEAVASLQQAISLRPSATGYRDQLARLYFQQKRYSRAIQEWQDLLNQNPKFIGAIKGIARSYEQLGAWGRALRYYERVLSVRPEDQSVLQSIKRIKKYSNTASKVSQ